MVSRVFMICNAYESGFGHGVKNDGLDLSKSPHGDPECAEAYQTGYEAGYERWLENQGPSPFIELDSSELLEIANKAFNKVVDHDFAGNPITDYDVLLWGAYGPAVTRLVNAVIQQKYDFKVQFEVPKELDGITIANRMNNCEAVGEVNKLLFGLHLKAGLDESTKESISKLNEQVRKAFMELASINT